MEKKLHQSTVTLGFTRDAISDLLGQGPLLVWPIHYLLLLWTFPSLYYIILHWQLRYAATAFTALSNTWREEKNAFYKMALPFSETRALQQYRGEKKRDPQVFVQ